MDLERNAPGPHFWWQAPEFYFQLARGGLGISHRAVSVATKRQEAVSLPSCAQKVVTPMALPKCDNVRYEFRRTSGIGEPVSFLQASRRFNNLVCLGMMVIQ